MTEGQSNPVPAHLVRVTHPDDDARTEQLRLDAPEGVSPEDHARQWLAGARNDSRWLDGHAEILPEPDPPQTTSDLEGGRSDDAPAGGTVNAGQADAGQGEGQGEDQGAGAGE